VGSIGLPAAKAASHTAAIFSILGQFESVKSWVVNLFGSDRKDLRARVAEVFPLLLAPTKRVVSALKSIRTDFSFRKFWISTKEMHGGIRGYGGWDPAMINFLLCIKPQGKCLS
jgi:hypothetical protein